VQESSHAQKFTKKGKGNFQDSWSYLNLDEYLTPKGIEMRDNARAIMTKIEPQLYDSTENATFPHHLVDELKKIKLSGSDLKGVGGPELPTLDHCSLIYEIGKIDASICTFLAVHNSLGQYTVYNLGNEEQKKRILSDTVPMNKVMAFGLTEPEYGSDAASIKTTAKKVEGGYLLNGQKRWIGNATFCDYTVIWARNEAEKGAVQCFVA